MDVPVQSAAFRAEGDRALRAGIGTACAEDAIGILHPALPDHAVNVEAHRAFLRALFTINTAGGIGAEPERRPPDKVPDLPARDHDNAHRAEYIAETPPAGKERGDEDDREDNCNDHQHTG